MKTFGWGVLIVLVMNHAASGVPGDRRHGSFLSGTPEAAHRFDVAAIADADVEGGSAAARYEVGVAWRMAYVGESMASADMLGELDVTVLSAKAGYDLPDALLAASIAIQGRMYFDEGWGGAVSIMPQLVGEFEQLGQGFRLPVSVALSRDVAPELKVAWGLSYRADYHSEIRPLFLISIDVSAYYNVDLGFPETRFSWFATADLRFYAGVKWLNQSYAVSQSGGIRRDMMTIRETHLFVEGEWQATPELAVRAGIGQARNREYIFEKQPDHWPRSLDVEDALMVSLSLVGPL